VCVCGGGGGACLYACVCWGLNTCVARGKGVSVCVKRVGKKKKIVTWRHEACALSLLQNPS
jgi:hypothetical protein